MILAVDGPARVGKRCFLEETAARLGRSLLFVDLSRCDRSRLAATLEEAGRDALLHDALPCLLHLDVVFAPAVESEGQKSERALPPALLRFLASLEAPLLVTSLEREPLLDLSARCVVHVAVPFPSPSQRAALFAEELAAQGATLEADVDLAALARRVAVAPGRVEAAVRAAVERTGEDRCVGDADLNLGCRSQLQHDLASIANRVTASHRWEDLVVSEEVYETLCEMTSYARHAEKVYDAWGFGHRHSVARGISALFAGAPGTGKTMCASVMARELDVELFQIDLSRVMSKWIGETEKNLARLFDEAERANAIILFDEADSLFGKRTEVKSSVDRYANLEVNFLLQRMEQFSGITILTTNFEDGIDAAFKRRLTFRLQFEKPDAEARALLWSKMFTSSCELAEDVSPERLGRRFDMSGANIRNAVVRAAFLAAAAGRPIDMAMCVTAAERECRELGLLVKSTPELAA